MPTPEPQKMVCMEVWGGCEPVDSAVTMAGLDAWVYSKPYADVVPAADTAASPQSDTAAAPIHESADPTEGGGDVYYVSSCATGRINRLLIADVSGHGKMVRQVATSLRDMMRKFVNFLDQSRFVTSLNKQFVETSAAGIFATAIVTTFFAPTRTLSVCNAGHPPPLVYRKSTGRWTLLDHENDGQPTVNIPLGIIDLEDCEQFGIELEIGDLVLIYTDSLIEARTADRELLGTAGLLRIANSPGLDPANPARFVPGLLASIESETGDTLNNDDVTCLLLRPNGTGATMTWGESFAAGYRVLRGFFQSLVRRRPLPLPEMSIPNIGGTFLNSLNHRWGKK